MISVYSVGQFHGFSLEAGLPLNAAPKNSQCTPQTVAFGAYRSRLSYSGRPLVSPNISPGSNFVSGVGSISGADSSCIILHMFLDRNFTSVVGNMVLKIGVNPCVHGHGKRVKLLIYIKIYAHK